VIGHLVLWLDDRLGAASFLRKAMRKAFPDHWAFMLGEVALYSYLALLGSGIYLTFFYTASGDHIVYHGTYRPLDGVPMSEAYASILRISFDVPAGLLIRQFHHWAALVFAAAISVHLLRIFFTGAFRRPREINWLIGVTLLLLAMAIGFTGYSLPDDLLSGTGLRIAYSILLSIPVVGTWSAFLLFGGVYPGADILRRFLILHIFLLQALIAALIGVHLFLIWHQKHTQFRGPGRTERNVVGSPLWPNYTMKSIGLALVIFSVLALLGGLAQINPVWLYGPYEAWQASSPAQPDWYLGWAEGALRLWPAWEIRLFGRLVANPFFPSVLFPVVFFLVLYLWPWIERWITGDARPHHLLDRARDCPWRSAVGAWAVAFGIALTLAGSNDVIANLLGVPVEIVTVYFRVMLGIAPILAAVLTYFVCHGLQERDRQPERRRIRAIVRVNARGGYEEETLPTPDSPAPEPGGGESGTGS